MPAPGRPIGPCELESCAKRCVVLANGEALDETLLPEDISRDMDGCGQLHLPSQNEAQGESAPPTREEWVGLLERHQGNVAAVGRDLGKVRMEIHRWLERYAIDINDHRR